MPEAYVEAFSQRRARSAPSSYARTMGAHPSDCTLTIRGRSGPIHPSASISSNAFHIPTIPVPPPVGYTITSGRLQPNACASSYPIVFFPSQRYGSLRVETSNAPVSEANARASAPAASMSPSTSCMVAPNARSSFLKRGGVSAGRNTSTRMPARAPYAASAEPAFPAVGIVTASTPSSFALDTAAEMPLALKLPVGLRPSSLTYSAEKPSISPRRDAGSRGVPPSPRVTTLEGFRTGISSGMRHRPGERAATSSRSSSRAARSRS